VVSWYDGFEVFDVSDPTNPSPVGYYNTGGSSEGLHAVEDYAYVADGANGLVILRLLRDKVTGTIGPAGGSLSSSDGYTTFAFPSGAVTDTVQLEYRHLLLDHSTNVANLTDIGHVFDVTAVYSNTGELAQLAPGHTYTVTVHYTDTERSSVIESTLALYNWDGSQWDRDLTSVVDTVNNTVTATPDHFSKWAVLGEIRYWRIYLPLIVSNH
jgi:hypothetical protein